MRDTGGSAHLPVALTLAGAAAGAFAAAWLACWAQSRPEGAEAGEAGAKAPAARGTSEPPGTAARGASAPPGAAAVGGASCAPGAGMPPGTQEALSRLRSAEGAVFDELQLSAHERCIGRHVMRGLTYREIAGRVYLAERTVKYHARSIYAKARVGNRRAFEAYVREAVSRLQDERGA